MDNSACSFFKRCLYEMMHLSFIRWPGARLPSTARSLALPQHDLSLAYTPGVAEPCREIEKNPDDVYRVHRQGQYRGRGDRRDCRPGPWRYWPPGSIPVMEGKAILFKNFAGIDAFPIAIASKDPSVIVDTVARIEPVFGGINLEDISAPRCFEVEERLKKILKYTGLSR